MATLSGEVRPDAPSLSPRPQAKLMAWMTFDSPGAAVDWQTDTEEASQALIEFAGRQCYLSWHNPSGRNNREYIENMLVQGHYSVIEHGVASFWIRGISRACSHEIVRHRHFSYSQLSQRYVASEDIGMVIPPLVADDPDLVEEFRALHQQAMQVYRKAVERLSQKMADQKPFQRRKMAREAARYVLPEGSETALVMTGNFRAWRHFIHMRASQQAMPEMRLLAAQVTQQLREKFPAVFGDFSLQQLPDGTYEAISQYHEM